MRKGDSADDRESPVRAKRLSLFGTFAEIRVVRRTAMALVCGWLAAIGVVDAVGSPQPFVDVGHYSNFRYTAEHQSGAGLDLWRDGSTLVGLFSYAAGPIGDAPTGRLEEVMFDASTGQISFRARLTMGEHYCEVHNAVPSQDVFRFSGVLTDESVAGTLILTDNLHPERAPIEEKDFLRWSDAEPVVRYTSREQWESGIEPILKFRGPRW